MKKFKRIVAVILALVMCGMVSFATPGSVVKAATKEQGTWVDEGNFTKNWISNETGKDVYGHEGTAEDPYEIQNEQDLAALSYCSNNSKMSFEGKYITVTAVELDMSAHYWEPIAQNSPIYGTINGNGCNIKNLSIGNKNYFSKENTGLIGKSCADINNVNLSNIKYYTNSINTGGLVGLWSAGTINGCGVNGLILSATNATQIGGIAGAGIAAEGRTLGTITNCTTSVEIGSYTDAYSCNLVGGIIGGIYSKTSVQNCTAGIETEVTNWYYVGGVAGYVGAYTQFSDCSAEYYIFAQKRCYCGGIVGKSSKCNYSVKKCCESGNIMKDDDNLSK